MISKKIIHLITTIEMGGAEKQLLILGREQKKLGIEVEIIYLKGKPELKLEFQSVGCKVNDLVANKRVFFQLLILVKYLRKSAAPIHAHLPKSELFAAFVCSKGQFIFTRHNAEDFWPGMPKLFSKLLSKWVCFRASQGIAISNAVKNYLVTTGEVSKNYKLDVVYYGYNKNLALGSGKKDEITKVINASSAKFKIGAIGRLVDQKDFPTLLRAFKKLEADRKESELFIIGDGVKKKFLENLCRQLEIENNVHFLGRSHHVLQFLKTVDIFILPSKYEGFGLVLLEAMSVKTPILAANNSSIPEVLGISYPGLFTTGNVEELSNLICLAKYKKSFLNSLISGYQEQLINFEPKIWQVRFKLFMKNLIFKVFIIIPVYIII